MAQNNSLNSGSKLNPISTKTIVPTQYLHENQIPAPLPVFFDVPRYNSSDNPATPGNGFNAYPIRTPFYVTSF